MRASEMAKGRWRELLPVLGVDSRYLVNRHGPCPLCNGSDRFRFDDQHGGGGYICNQCGAGDGFDLAMKVTGRSFRDIADAIAQHLGMDNKVPQRVADPEEGRNRNAMRRLWDGSGRPSEDSPVGLYLKSRVGCHWSSKSLREHSGVLLESRLWPVMVAKIISHDDKAVNLHRTFLTADGQKAPVSKAKLVMPGKLPDGCAIRLADAAPEMGVAEGIESAISAALMFDMPVWACVNGNLLSKWIPPEVAEVVTVFGDNDANFTGQSKAYQLANRLEVQYKRRVNVMLPPNTGTDWNDVHADQFGANEPRLRLVK